MRTLNGVSVQTTIEEYVDPARTAVVVVDMQNGVIVPEGNLYAGSGDPSNVSAIIPRIQRLLAAARRMRIPIAHTSFIHRSKTGVALTSGPDIVMHRNRPHLNDIVEGSWHAQTIPELAPQAGDIMIDKSRGSAFYHTALDDLLKARGVDNTILTGCVTEGCVLWTAAYAMHEGYYVTILRDCVASFDTARHEQALAFMETKFPVYGLDDVLATWDKSGR